MASVEDLEGQWDEPALDATPLVRKCHDLRGKDVNELSAEELRMLVGQHIGLRWLVPIAVDHIEREPLVSGDLYPGDLLVSLLGVPETYWADDTSSWLRLGTVAEQLVDVGEQAATWLATTRGGL